MPTGVYTRIIGVNCGFTKGRKHTKETRQKISEANRGNKNHLGKSHSEKTKKILSEANKKRYADGERFGFQKGHPKFTTKGDFKKGHIPWNKGKKTGLVPKTAFNGEMKGKNHWNWQGGITPEHLKIRQSIEYRLWEQSVLARDNYICQKCKERGGKLTAHHIQNFAQYPELRTAIANGITFCKECHKEFHKIYGIKNNNAEQIKEFLKVKKNKR